MKRQLVLYGPPGTGKTFNLKERALNLIHPTLHDEIEDIMVRRNDVEEEPLLLNTTEIVDRISGFYQQHSWFLTDVKFKPGKKPYRNMSSLNKLMTLFVRMDVNNLSKEAIIEDRAWRGPDSYIQHARILNNFDLVEESWEDRGRHLTLNNNGILLRDRYKNSYTDRNLPMPDRDLPDFAIQTIRDSIINTTSDTMTLWKNIIITTLWLGLERGYVFKYKSGAQATEEEKELLRRCCGYENVDLSYLEWAVTYLQDLELVNQADGNDARLNKYYLNTDAINMLGSLNILLEGNEEETETENTVEPIYANEIKYVIKQEYKSKFKYINNLFFKYNNESNRIEMITMHASFSYEDFLEGITVRCGTDKLEYYYKVGILKNISFRALKNLISKNIESGIIELGEGIEKETFIGGLTDWRSCFEVYVLHRDKLDWDLADDFILIIDEINRTDIVKVFGETITLIENDKRIGAKDEIIIKLPFTQEKFGIPKNIHFMCTMNTVDRSIGTMDLALRRRFNFIAVKPDLSIISKIYDVIPQTLDYDDNLLFKSAKAIENINNKVSAIPYIGQDKLIGHSYLMLGDVFEDVNIMEAWKYDILPLLEELFYDQFNQLRELLNYEEDNFIDDTLGFKKEDSEILKFIDYMVS